MTEAPAPSRFEPIALSSESTVVAEFVRPHEAREERYQSEAELERDLIARLQVQAYEYLRITSEADLIANLRRQLEALNKISFSDKEWQQFFGEKLAGANDGIVEKTARVQEDHIQVLKRDDGSTKNIVLIDKQSIHNNRLQVINQYESEGARATRFDVTVLVNGLPMVHIELKRRGVAAIVTCSLILSALFGMNGVWSAFPAAEAITLALTVFLLKRPQSVCG